MTKQEQIKKLFEELKPFDARALANWLQDKYDYCFDWYSVKASDEMKEIAKRIFELCPNANCIPVAYNNVCENDWYTEYEDYDNVLSMAYDYLQEDEGYGYQMPYFDDEMKKKEWREIQELMVKLHDLIGGEDSHEKGDYCEYSHPSFVIFDKEKNDFVHTEELR